MKIGILELLASQLGSPQEYMVGFLVNKQQASLTPQAISVWCRRMGHEVHYATWYGVGDPKAALPNDLDIVFIASHTRMAAIAYALGKLFRKEGVLTVVGGPHAKSFPQDCLRYFDLVILECDGPLLSDILGGQFDPNSILSSEKPFEDFPSIEERLPELRRSSFLRGKPYKGTFIPMLASIGCPYTCDFCSDWNVPYRGLSAERLREDAHFASENIPNVKLGFFDPNFGVRFDETITALESVPPGRRNPYAIESSLKLLNPDRLKRLRDTNCVAIAPGVESWTHYSNKAGVGIAKNSEKLEKVIEQFHELNEFIPYLAANFMVGLDTDEGEGPFELTREFIRRTPFVWPSLNIPIAFGGTPMYDSLLHEDRILKSMPLPFYQIPYLMFMIKNYDPVTYFQNIIDLHAESCSSNLLKMRLASTRDPLAKGIHYLRTWIIRYRIKSFQEMLDLLKSDKAFLDFHTGKTEVLPSYYANAYKRMLGKYYELVPLEESKPILSYWPIAPDPKKGGLIPISFVRSETVL